jgi:hypothetical protein
VPKIRAEGGAPKRTELPRQNISDETSVPAHPSVSGMDAINKPFSVNKPHARHGLRMILISLNIVAWIVIVLVVAYVL